MRVACHFTVPRPPRPELDAAVQDALHILSKVEGSINYLYPGQQARRYWPRLLSGLHQLRHLTQLDSSVDIHHIFANGLFPYPILWHMKKPIVYTSLISLKNTPRHYWKYIGRKIQCFTVTSDIDRQRLQDIGLDAKTVFPGIDLKNFAVAHCQPGDRFVLLAGSAPWNKEQFERKGFHCLLRLARQYPWLYLIFLWRGKLLDDLNDLIRYYGVFDKIEVISERVNVDEVLARSHAAIVLSDDQQLVKGYPHSLIESLAAGKPILVSNCLAMSAYVQRYGCGLSVDDLSLDAVGHALCSLRGDYLNFCKNVNSADMECFSMEKMVDDYLGIYKKIIEIK